MAEAIKALLYLRKSRADDPDEDVGETLFRHDEMLRDFAKKQNIVIVETYREVVSGDSLYARTEMLRMLGDIEQGQYDAVLCMDIDRLGRGSMSDQGIILDTLKTNDVRIITPRKVYDLNDEMDEDYTEFETFMARRELKSIKRRLQRGLRKTIEDGGYTANAPYGYTKTTVNKMPTLAINEDEAKYVRIIYDMYVNRGMGCQSIADAVNGMGAKPHRSDAFGRTSIMHILKNPVFCGKVTWDRRHHIRKGTRGNEKHITVYNDPADWVVVDGIHPPIISVELWEQAQEIIQNRYHPPYNRGEPRSPLAGVLRCRVCGRTMIRMPFDTRRPNGVDNLICPTRGCCAATRLDRVETAVLDALRDELESYQAQIVDGSAGKTKDYTAAADAVRKELATVEKQMDRLQDLLERGVYDVDTYLSRSATLKKRTAELKASLSAAEDMAHRTSADHIVAQVHKLTSGLEAYAGMDVQGKNRLLRSIIQSGTYYKEKGWSPTHFELEITLK